MKPLVACSGSTRDMDTIFNVKGLSEYLKVSPKWIYERTHLKEIPFIKVLGQLRFRKKDIDKWLLSYSIPVVDTPVVPTKIETAEVVEETVKDLPVPWIPINNNPRGVGNP